MVYFTVILLLILTNDINAITYYVDSDGGNDRNSGTSSLAAWNTISKVNSKHFNFGDTISFKCGDRFSGVTLYTYCDGLTFNSYGSGARPVIDGQSSVMCCEIGSKSNITFNGIKFVHGINNPGGEVGMWGAHDIVFESCNIDSGAGDKYRHSNLYAGGHSYNITIRNCTISYGQNNVSSYNGCLGFYIDGVDHLLMEYDTLIGNFSNFRIAFGDGNMTTNSIIRYCVAKYGRWDNIDDSGSNGLQVYYNVFETFSNNLYFFCNGDEGSITDQYVPRRSYYYNNTFISHGNGGNHILVRTNTYKDTGSVFKNNIFYSDGLGHRLYEDLSSNGGIVDWTFDNNLYYGGTGWYYHGVNYKSFKSWKALGFDANSINANPLFTKYSAGDYSLQSGSPARNAGTNVGLTNGINGNSGSPHPPDIGAFQYLHIQ